MTTTPDIEAIRKGTVSSATEDRTSPAGSTAGDSFDALREKGFLPPLKRTVIPPEGGWEPSCYYEVIVASNRNNPCHQAILYTGFLNDDKTPGSYSAIWNAAYEDGPVQVREMHYIWAKKLLMRGRQ